MLLICFSNKIGISQSYLSAILKGKRGASAELIAGLYIHYRKYLSWLLTGESEATSKLGPKTQIAEGVSIYKVEDDDPETAGLIKMTREILKSGTDYSASLAANIRSFHHAIKTETRLNKMEGELTVLKNMFTDLARENEKLKKRLDKKGNYPERKIAVGEK